MFLWLHRNFEYLLQCSFIFWPFFPGWLPSNISQSERLMLSLIAGAVNAPSMGALTRGLFYWLPLRCARFQYLLCATQESNSSAVAGSLAAQRCYFLCDVCPAGSFKYSKMKILENPECLYLETSLNRNEIAFTLTTLRDNCSRLDCLLPVAIPLLGAWLS